MPVPEPEIIEVTTTPHRLRRQRRRRRAPAGLAADRPGEGLGRVRLLRPALRAEARHRGGGPLSALRTRLPPAPDRRLGLHLPRLPRAAAPDPQVRRPAGRRGRRLLQHGLEDAARDQGGRRADPRRGHLRQVRGDLPQRALPGLQGAAPAGARRPRAAVPADPRRDPRLQPALHRAGGLRGRRHHRDLRHAGRGARRAGDDRLGRQGPDAARRPRHRRCSTP